MTRPIAPARKAAFDLLLELRNKPGSHSDTLLHSRRIESLSAIDKNLATTLLMGVLRWEMVLEDRIRTFLNRDGGLADPVQIALELGALQLLLLDRIPPHAAINESVELARHSGNEYAVGMVNAVLRKLAQTPKLNANDPTTAAAAHPEWIVDRWRETYGSPAAEAICCYDQAPPPSTIRLISPQAATLLEEKGVQLESGAYVTQARRVTAGDINGSTTQSLLRIQDEGSQLIAELAGHGEIILDCCAAPGGKTAILAERNPEAELIACDISAHRLKAMQSMPVLRNVNFRVLDATGLPWKNHFDLILCDAPCSGTGTMARNPEIRHRITVEEFTRQQERQVRLLQSAMHALREGGRLVFSTCSLEPEENEHVVAEALEREKGFHLQPWREQIQALEAEGILNSNTEQHLFPAGTPDNYLRTLPGNYPGDGFFAACLTRG
jgi:16S rRNA (cytosine967-C5)-methyltransferase